MEPSVNDPPDLQSHNDPTMTLNVLSKKAQKKALKAERLASQKPERRAREKQAKKEKKRVLAQKRAAGELDECEDERRRAKKPKTGPAFGGRVVVDLGFDDMMTDKEITSLCSQLAYTYSANRRAAFPFKLMYTSLGGRTFAKLEGMTDAGYKRWAKTEWSHEGYEILWQTEIEGEACTSTERESTDSTKQNTVYLTADSEEELKELNSNETYIIGGLCDHNRYKNLCLDKAKNSGIRSARLPIGRYLTSLPTRKVLTVNQVFEILLYWVETRDWEEAFYAVIPQRKFIAGGKGESSRCKDNGTAEGDEAADSTVSADV